MVDTHVHVVSPDRERHPLSPGGLPGGWYLERPVSAEQFRAEMRGAGVQRAVLVQAVGAYSFDNAYVAEAARGDRTHFRGACALDARDPSAAERLRGLVREGGIGSVRVFALAAPGESWLARPETFGIWQVAHELGIPAIATVFEHQLGDLAQVLARVPGLRVGLDHCGFPDLKDPDWESRGALFGLAQHRNLALKVSSHLLHEIAASGRDPARVVARLCESFGAERLMWGSDYPQTPGPYAELVAQGRAAFASLGPAARQRALGQNALDWFFT
jgi:predicted TIM-barrel fold metal-dependent hydrolase